MKALKTSTWVLIGLGVVAVGLGAALFFLRPAELPFRFGHGSFMERAIAPELAYLYDCLYRVASFNTKVTDYWGESFDKYVRALGVFRVRLQTCLFLTDLAARALAGPTASTESAADDPDTAGATLHRQ